MSNRRYITNNNAINNDDDENLHVNQLGAKHPFEGSGVVPFLWTVSKSMCLIIPPKIGSTDDDDNSYT